MVSSQFTTRARSLRVTRSGARDSQSSKQWRLHSGTSLAHTPEMTCVCKRACASGACGYGRGGAGRDYRMMETGCRLRVSVPDTKWNQTLRPIISASRRESTRDRPTLARPPAGITACGLLCPAGGPKVASPYSPEFEGDAPPQTRAKTFLSPSGHTPFQAPASKEEGCSGAHPSTLETV